MTFIRLANVKKSFGNVPVLNGIDLSLDKGSFVALLGASGSGKTTLLRMIAGLESPGHGRIYIGDVDVTDIPPEQRFLAMMFQSYALFPHMTVLENVRFPLKMQRKMPKGEQLERSTEALKLVKLDHLGARSPRALSGGQQQRVALARAIVSQPRVLLLDEPLSNLDARLREDMQIELQELHRKLGLTTIFVTHDQEEALSLADRVILLRDGLVIRDAPADEIYDQPRSAFAADFLGAGNIIKVAASRSGQNISIRFSDGQTLNVDSQESPTDRILLRQEDLSILPATAPRQSDLVSIAGKVAARVFLGTRVRYVVCTESDQFRTLVGRREQFAVGDDVQIAWSPSAMRWLPN